MGWLVNIFYNNKKLPVGASDALCAVYKYAFLDQEQESYLYRFFAWVWSVCGSRSLGLCALHLFYASVCTLLSWT